MTDSSGMNFWLFCTVDSFDGEDWIPARSIIEARVRVGAWPIGARTPHKEMLKRGDVAILYVGGSRLDRLSFIGEVVVEAPISRPEARLLAEADHVGEYPYFIPISSARFFERPVPIKVMPVALLGINTSHPKWGAHLQGGLKRLSPGAYSAIVGYGKG